MRIGVLASHEGTTLQAVLDAVAQGRMAPAAGAVLLYDEERNVIGAIGISGDTSDRDEECALAGLVAAGLKA